MCLDIICPSKLTVFLKLRSQKTVRFSEQIMSVDKYPSIFRVKWRLLFILPSWCWNLERTLSYWTNGVKSFVILNQWRQNDIKSAARYRLLNYWLRKPGARVCHFWWAENKRAKWRNSVKNGKIFWMNNKGIIEFGFQLGYKEFCRSWRVLYSTLLDL